MMPTSAVTEQIPELRGVTAPCIPEPSIALSQSCVVKRRLFVSCLIAIASGLLAIACCRISTQPGIDFGLSWMQARELLAGRSPYPHMQHPSQILYPLTSVLYAIPFTVLPANIAGGLFFGISCGLLAFFITKEGFHRLLIFTSLPFMSSVMAVQWIPLLMVSIYLPWLGAMAMKPQIGIACAIASRKWSALWSTVLVGLMSLVIRPLWPIEFLHQAKSYPFFIPVAFFVGPLIIIAARWWRDKDSQLLLLMATVPQRFFYDAFVLWLIPKTSGEIIFMSACSWTGFIFWSHLTFGYYDIWMWSVCCNYLAGLAVIIKRQYATRTNPELVTIGGAA
jgi:hypothetical protein